MNGAPFWVLHHGLQPLARLLQKKTTLSKGLSTLLPTAKAALKLRIETLHNFITRGRLSADVLLRSQGKNAGAFSNMRIVYHI